MKIPQDFATLSELLKQQQAAARNSEKAVTQATTAELGMAKENNEADNADLFFGPGDTARLSVSALNRYRALAGAKTADEEKQQGAAKDGLTRGSYERAKAGSEGFQEERAAAVGGDGQARPTQDTPQEGTRHASGLGGKEQGDQSMHASGQAEGLAAGAGQDPLKRIRERIKEVQRMLSEAQAGLAQATARLSAARMVEKSASPALSSEPVEPLGRKAAAVLPRSVSGSNFSAGAQKEGPRSDAAAEIAAEEAAVAGAQTEVKALQQELEQLQQELLAAVKQMSG